MPRMWMLALVAGALLERGKPALEAVRPEAISASLILGTSLAVRIGPPPASAS